MLAHGPVTASAVCRKLPSKEYICHLRAKWEGCTLSNIISVDVAGRANNHQLLLIIILKLTGCLLDAQLVVGCWDVAHSLGKIPSPRSADCCSVARKREYGAW